VTNGGGARGPELQPVQQNICWRSFEARPVVPVADAIRVEREAMAYRDGLKK
jgi:hypothetical protein